MSVHDYRNITYYVTGMSVINDPKDTNQEGILIYMRHDLIDPHSSLTIFVDKRDCAHIAKTTQEGRRFWKKFRLPKMVRQ
jgi:hypothetical protein